MKNKNDEAFLKSVLGVVPINKKDIVKKPVPKTTTKTITRKKQNNTTSKSEDKICNKKTSSYKIEKSNINKKLKKGKIPIDKKIDFHGMSVLDAEELFSNSIISLYNRKKRCLLFITGKRTHKNSNENIPGAPKLYYGKIREGFFSWIKKTELQKYILSVEQAGIEYGADGAFFVYLRKKKPNL